MDEQPLSGVPIAYLLTLRSYGTWLHGDEKTSVDRHGFNVFGTARVGQSQILQDSMKAKMKQTPMLFDKAERVCILESAKEVCEFRGYELLAFNIRSNHLHAVVSAGVKPEKIVNDFKAYATRKLRWAGLVEKDATVWARGKSGRYLWKPRHVEIAVDYVLFGQGDAIPEFD